MEIIKRKIESIFNNDSGKDEKASQILNVIKDQDDYVRLRRDLRIRNKKQNPPYLCAECGTPLELSCTPNEKGEHTFYFKHLKDPGFDKCSIKTGVELNKQEIERMRYAFKSESNAHKLLKQKAGAIIQEYIDPDAIIDKKFILGKFEDIERRKPDIYFNYKNREITIEFQINNTFHSVIQEREEFYERNKVSLMWVFGEFDPKSFQSITIKDIYVPNGNNAFVFDDDAEKASNEKKTLCLKVWYKKYEITNDKVEFEWQNEIITIDQLKYNSDSLRPYFFNCEADKTERQKELSELFQKHKNEQAKLGAIDKANHIKQFLTKFRNDDHLPYEYNLLEVNVMKSSESQTINNVLKLDETFKNGNNIIQALLMDNKRHDNLITFLLKAKTINIPLQTVNEFNETTLITTLKNTSKSSNLPLLLFASGYKMNHLDKDFLSAHYSDMELKEILFQYCGFEKLANLSQIEYFHTHLNKFLVIESAKNGKTFILGNEKQSLVWMANLTAEKYSAYWYYFDLAFSHYKLYDKIFLQDKNGSFQKNYDRLSSMSRSRNLEFEEVVGILYPEILKR